jgi:cobalt/nickel transport system permease protein
LHFDLTDQYQDRPSSIHDLDPRVKLVLTILYILGLSLTPEAAWLVFLVWFIMLLLVVRWAQLGPTYTIRRSYIAAPFIMAALPILFILDGGRTLITLPGLGWTVSTAGFDRFFTILIRTWIGVQAGILLTVSTRFPDLIWALDALHMPKVLVAIISFMYRYLFVLIDQSMRMRQARASRSAVSQESRRPSAIWHAKVAGMMVGSLFLRSLERSERVYAAMASRGYDGEMRILNSYHMRPQDWFGLAMGSIILFLPLFIPFIFIR